jgi:hypothetical protein
MESEEVLRPSTAEGPAQAETASSDNAISFFIEISRRLKLPLSGSPDCKRARKFPEGINQSAFWSRGGRKGENMHPSSLLIAIVAAAAPLTTDSP